MDWHKSKTILIIVLIITNIILLGIYINTFNHSDKTLSADFISETKSKLENYGIFVDTEIPNIKPSLVSQYLSVELYNENYINTKFFEDKGVIIPLKNGIRTIENGTEKIEIHDDILFIYYSTESDKEYEINSMDDAQEFAETFMNKKGIFPKNAEFDYGEIVDGKYILHYANVVNDVYVEESSLNIILNETGVKRVEKKWLNVEDEFRETVYLNTAPKVLRSLIGRDELKGKTIKSISLCHYFSSEDYDFENENINQGLSGKSMPAWRVFFTDGTKIIIRDM